MTLPVIFQPDLLSWTIAHVTYDDPTFFKPRQWMVSLIIVMFSVTHHFRNI